MILKKSGIQFQHFKLTDCYRTQREFVLWYIILSELVNMPIPFKAKQALSNIKLRILKYVLQLKSKLLSFRPISFNLFFHSSTNMISRICRINQHGFPDFLLYFTLGKST